MKFPYYHHFLTSFSAIDFYKLADLKTLSDDVVSLSIKNDLAELNIVCVIKKILFNDVIIQDIEVLEAYIIYKNDAFECSLIDLKTAYKNQIHLDEPAD